MKKYFGKLLGGVLMFSLSMSLTSCEDILGEWSRPTPNPVTPSGGTASVTSISIDPTLALKVGETGQLTATVDPAGTAVTWSSDQEAIATVDANGLVTAKADGTATITAKAGDKSASCTVTVTEVNAANEYNEAYWYDGKVVFTKETAASVTAVTNSDTDVTWGAGWYTVSGNVIIKGKVTLSADTHLILQDGATLTINGQLDCRTNSKDLYIYGQMEGTGKLNITCNDNALYGDPGYTLHIHGGEITATATGDSHYGLYFGKIVMYSGKLTATAADYHAIGFNVHGFIVYGGEVEATSNATTGDFSGIQSSGPLKVYVGKVKGTGGAPSGKGFECEVQTGTSNIKFYFSDNGTTWGPAYSYNIAAPAPGNRYAKAE